MPFTKHGPKRRRRTRRDVSRFQGFHPATKADMRARRGGERLAAKAPTYDERRAAFSEQLERNNAALRLYLREEAAPTCG
jgi:hypothetical protein